MNDTIISVSDNKVVSDTTTDIEPLDNVSGDTVQPKNIESSDITVIIPDDTTTFDSVSSNEIFGNNSAEIVPTVSQNAITIGEIIGATVSANSVETIDYTTTFATLEVETVKINENLVKINTYLNFLLSFLLISFAVKLIKMTVRGFVKHDKLS